MRAPPQVVVVMGVSGSGKTTVGSRLARALGWDFVDGDDLHSPANVAKMAAGIGLDDADRAGWLDAIAALVDERIASRRPAVIAASALKRAYRGRLAHGRPEVAFVYLEGDEATLRERLRGRRGHFAGEDLLASQLATLEPPSPEEGIAAVSIAPPPDAIVGEIRRRLAI